MAKNVDFHQKAYVCIHVFHRERPVLLITRPDGDWCFLCGDEHEEDASAYRVVGIGHVLEHDPSIEAVLDLAPGWDAERSARDQPWRMQPIPEDDAI
jgi:hypothetical protein